MRNVRFKALPKTLLGDHWEPTYLPEGHPSPDPALQDGGDRFLRRSLEKSVRFAIDPAITELSLISQP